MGGRRLLVVLRLLLHGLVVLRLLGLVHGLVVLRLRLRSGRLLRLVVVLEVVLLGGGSGDRTTTRWALEVWVIVSGIVLAVIVVRVVQAGGRSTELLLLLLRGGLLVVLGLGGGRLLVVLGLRFVTGLGRSRGLGHWRGSDRQVVTCGLESANERGRLDNECAVIAFQTAATGNIIVAIMIISSHSDAPHTIKREFQSQFQIAMH